MINLKSCLSIANTMHKTNMIYISHFAKIVRKYKRLEIILRWLVAISLTPFFINPNILNDEVARWYLSVIPLLGVLIPLLRLPEKISKTLKLHEVYSDVDYELVKIINNLKLLNKDVNLNNKYQSIISLQDKLAKYNSKTFLVPEIEEIQIKLIDNLPMAQQR